LKKGGNAYLYGDGGTVMARTVGIGIQNFEKLITEHCFYVDKTDFIREWWENKDDVTLIIRPRRFGKTLSMNMLERFLSIEYAGQGEIFGGLSIWKDGKYRNLQGSWPVIFLSFADVKANTFTLAKEKICMLIKEVYRRHDYLLKGGSLKQEEQEAFRKIYTEMKDSETAYSLKNLSGYLSCYYGKKVIILLDEYDTPLQEAWVYGYWREMAELIHKRAVQFHILDQPVSGTGGYDGDYEGQQRIYFFRSE